MCIDEGFDIDQNKSHFCILSAVKNNSIANLMYLSVGPFKRI